MPKPVVFVEERPLTGRVVQLGDGVVVGREGCEVVLPDPEVSRRHAELTVVDDLPTVTDLGSTNGTWVNGRRITAPTPIGPGDVLRFGNTVWNVRSPDAPTRVASDPDFADLRP